MKGRLVGKTVLVTRPVDQSRELCQLLEAEGARTIVQPAIEILPPESWDELDAAFQKIANRQVDWAVFSSSNGVRFAFDRLRAIGKDARSFFINTQTRVASVGSSTAESLREYGVTVDLVPRQFDADGLVDALVERVGSPVGLTVVSFRASRGRKTFAERLTSYGAKVIEIAVYRSVDVKTPQAEALKELQAGRIDFATATSSASARALCAMFGSETRKTRWIALSSLTGEALLSQGVAVDSVANSTTMAGLVEAVVGANAQ